ncbi:MAG: hypothetical protein ACREK8_03425 [Gemmatimonadales bacterium]
MQRNPCGSQLVRVVRQVLGCTLIAACGSHGTRADAQVAGGGTTCSIVLTGAQSGSPPCSDDRTAMYGIKEQTTLVGFSSNDSLPGVMIAIKFVGAPATKTYRSSEAGASQGIMVRRGNMRWVAQGGTQDHPLGSYVLTLTSVKEVPFATDVKGYDVHGTITATLQPDPGTGASGTVTLSARF